MAQLRCIVVTPERTVVDGRTDFVALPLYDGEIGIAPLHSPMIGRMGVGELRLGPAGSPDVYYVEGGFVEVLDDVVTVLTNRAIPAGSLTIIDAERALEKAMSRPFDTPEKIESRERAVSQARARLRVAQRYE